MAALVNIRESILAAADKAIATGRASRKLGYETFLSVEFDTSLATPGLRVSFRHHTTEIIKAHIRPQGLNTAPAKLYRLTVHNGGFRSKATYGRLADILAVFGIHIQRREGREALQGDRLYGDGWEAPLFAETTLFFDANGVMEEYNWDDQARAYPSAEEARAIDWLGWFARNGNLRAARELFSDVYYETRKDDKPYMGHVQDPESRADYIANQASAGYLRRQMQGLRLAFAQHYGSSRDGLDILLDAWRSYGCPDAKGRPTALAAAEG